MPQTALEEKLKEIRRKQEERRAQDVAREKNVGYFNLDLTPVETEAIKLIPREQAEDAFAAPFQIKYKTVAIAAFDPSGEKAKQMFRELETKGYKIEIAAVSKSSLEKIWKLYKSLADASRDITGKIELKQDELNRLNKEFKSFKAFKEFLESKQAEDITIALKLILAKGVVMLASDVHIEPKNDKSAEIRVRIDGVLNPVAVINHDIYTRLRDRIKLSSGLKLNIQDVPQDGRLTIKTKKYDIEVRSSSLPGPYGENLVLRFLNPELIKSVKLEELGLRKDDLEIIKKYLEAPTGLILNTGPTGSGKTTTLYSFLHQINNPGIKIITIEDPIEYKLEGIEQSQINPSAGYDFANGLRSILRQDPEIIMVGEIRDTETASITMHASLTGHLVFSTLHTNDAIGAVPRLLDLGIKPEIVAPAVKLTIAQRLIRLVCKFCAVPKQPDAVIKNAILTVMKNIPKRADFHPEKEYKTIPEARGCEKCNFTGYHYMTAVFELLETTPEIETIIHKGATETMLREQARRQNMVTMMQDGLIKLAQGLTTIEEIERVLGKI